jgi:hypothetical protein
MSKAYQRPFKLQRTTLRTQKIDLACWNIIYQTSNAALGGLVGAAQEKRALGGHNGG